MSVIIGGRWESFFAVPSGQTISVTNNGGGPTIVTIAAGSYTITSFCSYLQTALTAQRAPSGGAWSVSVSVGRGGTGLVTIAMSSGTFSITWTSTNTRDILGFTATVTAQTSATATRQAGGLWMPNCPLVSELDPSGGWKQTDNRSTEGPTGGVVTHGGTKKYQHKSIRYSHVEQARIREAAAVAAGISHASLEQWINDTQIGDGHTWFSRGSRSQVYWDNNGTETLLGADMNSGAGPSLGWAFSPAIDDVHNLAKRVDSAWLGMWSVEFSRLVSAG